MSDSKTLRVRARGASMVPDLVALEAGARRFVGRAFDASSKDESKGVAGHWPAVGDVDVLDIPEYVRDVREGSLYAADAATAKRCGVEFDPTFGGDL